MVAGGWNGGSGDYYLSSTEIMVVTEGTWMMAGNLNTPRVGLSILVSDNKVLAMGGYEYDSDNYLSSVEQFRVSTFNWISTRTTTHLLQARAYHAVTTVPVTMFDCEKH